MGKFWSSAPSLTKSYGRLAGRQTEEIQSEIILKLAVSFKACCGSKYSIFHFIYPSTGRGSYQKLEEVHLSFSVAKIEFLWRTLKFKRGHDPLFSDKHDHYCKVVL